MNELVFQVEFLSDIVLPATSNTEGNIEQLDFIPGSNFLGMVALDYKNFENSFEVFHSANVRFGDATILHQNKQTYKMPLSFFHEKLDDTNIFTHHHIKDFKKFTQLKQVRKGYISSNLDIIHIDYNYSQKSAYDKDNRRSKEGSMFGYNAMKSGTKWQFTLKYSDISKNDLERIQSNLLGVKRLGKSKSAQYGEVKISLQGTNENLENINIQNEVVLYANARIALVDDEGNATYDLKYICPSLKDENIIYEKSQLRTSLFTPYNGAREKKDYERVVINKGSIIVLKEISKEQLQSIKNGVGAYLSEGFGELLVNPSFLHKAELRFNKPTKENVDTAKLQITDKTVLFLQTRENAKKTTLNLANEVEAFLQEHQKLYSLKMNSQWGTIRSICSNSNDSNIHDDVKEYISKGVAKDKWEGKKASALLNAINNSSKKLEFTKLLSMQMPKVKITQEELQDAN